MRVLHMCAVDFTVWHFIRPLARKLHEAGYDVSICCGRGDYFAQLEQQGFRMIENPISRSANVVSHFASLWRTYRLLRKERFDVVHVHTPIAALVGRIAASLARVRVKIYTAHGFYFHENMRPLAYKLVVALERVGGWCGDFTMTVSREDEMAAIRLGLAHVGKIETIYNGVDTQLLDPSRFSESERLALRQELGIGGKAPVIGFVGRLVREKGIFEFFEAAAEVLERHPEARFLVVGAPLASDRDQLSGEMHERVRQLGLESALVFTGLVPDTTRYLSIMDAFCLPSYREGMPVSLLEAMAMELPCIATDVRGCREEVVNGSTGWLVPARDSGSLADRMTWLLDNPTEAAEMGRAGRRRVQEMFDEQKVLQHELAIYQRLTGGPRA